ncbi:phospholipase D family protein [Paenibacillus campi]|uniref:phospholipase D family protein n=1 Tax=Paenibacillus campi TaxID=3106031 RepID=UPI002B003AC7|nr:phospholipase D family protein [Paenibacillus sp. SGZ-1009]
MNAFPPNSPPIHTSRASKHKRKRRLPLIRLMLGLLVVWLIAVMIYQTHKPLPAGVSYESPLYTVDHVNFYYDLTYPAPGSGDRFTQKRHIYDRILQMVDEANHFIVIDMFLFNNYVHKGQQYPPLSEGLANRLIQRKQKQPDLQIVFITDEVNTNYNSSPNPLLEKMSQAGINIIMTDVDPLRDSTPLYSAVWRTFFQWFGQAGEGTIPNAMATSGPDVTIRSYLKLINVKANHRKAVITDRSALVSTGNVHDASAYHSNVAFEVQGAIIGDLLKAEQAVVDLSGYSLKLPTYTATASNTADSDSATSHTATVNTPAGNEPTMHATTDDVEASNNDAAAASAEQTYTASFHTKQTAQQQGSSDNYDSASIANYDSTNIASTIATEEAHASGTGTATSTSTANPTTPADNTAPANSSDKIQIRYLTEGKVYNRVLEAIGNTQKGDTLWMGMFYLADRQVTSRLLAAAERGVMIRLILDPNQNAFGQDKIGIPNRPVAAELNDKSNGRIGIRWYNTTDEQYHTKLMYIHKPSGKDLIIGGSSNFTPRNLKDYNLENDLWMSASNQNPLMVQVNSYFNMLWNNDGEQYTMPLSMYQEQTTWLKDIAYRLQLILGFTTF